MLRGIIENTVLCNRICRIGSGNNIFQGFCFPFGAGDQLVAIINISFVMQIMVKFEGFAAHAILGERIVGIRQVW